MKITLCTYEHPAARHMIEDWRKEKANDISVWGLEDFSYERVALFSGELLFIVPIENGRSDERLQRALNAITNETRMLRPIGKFLHFGRVPIGDPRWQRLVW